MGLYKKKTNGGVKKKLSTKLIFGITIICCVLLFIIISSIEPEEVEVEPTETVLRKVSVVKVKAKEIPAKINLHGEAIPEWQTSLKSQVDGKIISVSPEFRIGNRVKKGDELLQIENSQYIAMAAEAEARFSTAAINLLREQKEAEEAKKNWERSGINENPSPLVLREPQLKAAQNDYDAAEASLRKAKLDLSYTKIVAPFNGIVVQRNINLGGSVMPGQNVAFIYSTDKLFINVFVTNKQFELLSSDFSSVKAKLISKDTGAEWDAKVVRDGQVLATTNRLRTMVLEVNNPYEKDIPLLAGSFLTVELSGKPISNMIKISEASLTKGGFMWTVDSNDELQSYKVDPLFYFGGEVYFTLPKGAEQNLRIAVNPNSTFMNGFVVDPLLVEEGE